jgi:peptidyl-prolyl cis-trans isomerase-like protein 2
MLNNSTGVIFEYENILEYVQKHKSDPVTGDSVSGRDIIQLHMQKNSDGEWECPITNRVFNGSAHIIAIRTTGNVFSYNAIEELNIKPKIWTDLIDGSKFSRSDIITLQDPQNPEVMARRDISQFTHLQQVRDDAAESRRGEQKVRHSVTSEAVMQEIERRRQTAAESGVPQRTTEDILRGVTTVFAEDVARFQALNPLAEDVNPGLALTTGKVSSSFTSTSSSRSTVNERRLAAPNEIREARWKIMRELKQKSLVQMQTSVGNLNLEIHTDIAMRTGWNFVTLCKRGYYDNTLFHRLIPGFMIQGGDPTGTGKGGSSAFADSRTFRDEFDTRLQHDRRGVLSMANSGPNSASSQFFITFKETPHLNLKHAVFGYVVGGKSTLDRMEQIATGNDDRPVEEIKILSTVVFSDPIDEADAKLEEFIRTNMNKRLKVESSRTAPLPTTATNKDIDDSSAPKRIRL